MHVRDVRLPRTLLSLSLPLVAAAAGHAIGGGLMIAVCCDVAVAARERRYGLNFTDLGFTPGMGATELLPALVGSGFAAEMMMTAKLYRGVELDGRGLFAHVVPSADVETRAMDLAMRIADKPTAVLRMLKTALARPRLEALERALGDEHDMHAKCFGDPETIQRVNERHSGASAATAQDRAKRGPSGESVRAFDERDFVSEARGETTDGEEQVR
jgi:polyketide biosynthesis enoyl-CoA hydratase PksI